MTQNSKKRYNLSFIVSTIIAIVLVPGLATTLLTL